MSKLDDDALTNKVALDVTHLINSSIFSGSQRVLHEVYLFSKHQGDFIPIALFRGKVRKLPISVHKKIEMRPTNPSTGNLRFWGLLRSFQARLIRSRLSLLESLLSKLLEFLLILLNTHKSANWGSYEAISNCAIVIVNPIHRKSDLKAWRRLQTTSNNILAIVIHDLLPIQKPDLFPRSRITSFQRYLDFTSQANVVFFVSEKTKSDYLHYFESQDAKWRNQQHFVINPNGLNPAAFSDRQFKVKSIEAPDVLCVSTFEPRKNHIQLLTACVALWEQGEKFTLTLAGSTGWANQHINQKIDEVLRDFPDNLRVLRNPSDDELASAYHETSFCVYPAIDEGYGLPVTESVAFKKKVICNNIPSIASLDRSDYLLMDGTLESLIDSMKKALVRFPKETVTSRINPEPIGKNIFEKCKARLTGGS